MKMKGFGFVTIILIGLLALSGCTTTKDFYGLKLIDNPKAQDVSSAELMAFLERDKTNEHDVAVYNAPADRTLEELVNSGYMCMNFAVDLHNNAERAGIRCALVENSKIAHAFNAFSTTDKGLVYADASSGIDYIVEPVEGLNVVFYCKVREGVADTCLMNLGRPKEFKIKW